jgi:pantoate--beta-alanine ligase
VKNRQGFDDTAEGRSRPGHFRGVATIVLKLLNIVQPSTLYLGQKDAAQCVMIRRIVEDLNLMDECKVEVVPTVREADGLALSSRNAYLTQDERSVAPIVYQSLRAAKASFDNYKLQSAQDVGKRTIASRVLREAVEAKLRQEPLVSAIHYVSIDNRETMRPVDHVDLSEGAIVSLACQVGTVRLIDNIMLS